MVCVNFFSNTLPLTFPALDGFSKIVVALSRAFGVCSVFAQL